MSAENREMVKANGLTAPQYYNPGADQYEYLHGIGGAAWYRVRGTVVKDTINANEDVTRTYGEDMYGFSIINDGVDDVVFTIGNIILMVKENEAFSSLFEPFRTVNIVATGEFRAVIMQ